MSIYRAGISLWGMIAWSLAAFFFLYEFLLRTFVGFFSHQIIPDLSLNAEKYSLLGTGYFVAYGLMQIPAGLLIDRFGVKKALCSGALVCALSAILFSMSTAFAGAFFSRVLMGFGSSFAFVSLILIVMTWFPRAYHSFFIGISQFVGTLGPMLGGEALIFWMSKTHQPWQMLLAAVGVFGLLLAFLMLFLVKEGPRTSKGRDPVQEVNLPASQQLRLLFFSGTVWSLALYTAMVYAALGVMGVVWGPEYLEARGFSQAVSGEIVSLAWLGYAIGCPLLGVLSDRFEVRKPFLIGCSLWGTMVAALIIYLPGYTGWVAGALFFGLGLAASGQNVSLTAMAEQVPSNLRASAVGFNNGMISMFDAIVPVVMGYFIHLGVGGQRLASSLSEFKAAFSLIPILYFLSVILAVFCIQPKKKPLSVAL